eukprot:scaffold352909_cov53-Prasinocladus_malaysianus.AAC.1
MDGMDGCKLVKYECNTPELACNKIIGRAITVLSKSQHRLDSSNQQFSLLDAQPYGCHCCATSALNSS